MRLPWPLNRFEFRQASVTDRAIETLIGNAASAPADAEALAAVEISAGLWGRSLSMASITPQTPFTAPLTPQVMLDIGRDLARLGEYVALIDVDSNNRLALRRAASCEVRGGLDPATWRYKLQLETPSGEVERRAPARGVVHIRNATNPSAPWRGLSPIAAAPETATLAAKLERSLRHDVSIPTGAIMALPDGATKQQYDHAAKAVKDGKGGLTVLETTAQGYGQGPTAAPKKSDYEQTRFGAVIEEHNVTLRRDTRADVLAVYGVQNVLAVSGIAAREGWREFVLNTLAPVGEIVTLELADKLETPALDLDLAALSFRDINQIQRAVKGLTDSGVSLDDALKLAGVTMPPRSDE